MLDEVGWYTPHPGRFILRNETRHPLYRRLGEPWGRSGRVGKISPPPTPGVEPRIINTLESRYTDYAIPVALTLNVQMIE
jgi:hypothetical protein